MMFNARKENCEVKLTSDALGRWGCGAFCGREWFQLQWPERVQASNITVKELVPIVLAAALWGSGWKGKCVMSY